MKTVVEHLKDLGYDVAKAWNANWLEGRGTMECERIDIRKSMCSPECGEMMLRIEATAIVPFSDGGEYPYPSGWPKCLEASVTALFRDSALE